MSGKTIGTKSKIARGESSDVAGIALVASAIGNLWQASQRATLERDRAQLQRDRDFLVSALQEWQRDHARLATRVASLAKAYEALEDVDRTLRRQNADLEKDNAQWRAKYFEAEQRFGKLAKEELAHSPSAGGDR